MSRGIYERGDTGARLTREEWSEFWELDGYPSRVCEFAAKLISNGRLTAVTQVALLHDGRFDTGDLSDLILLLDEVERRGSARQRELCESAREIVADVVHLHDPESLEWLDAELKRRRRPRRSRSRPPLPDDSETLKREGGQP